MPILRQQELAAYSSDNKNGNIRGFNIQGESKGLHRSAKGEHEEQGTVGTVQAHNKKKHEPVSPVSLVSAVTKVAVPFNCGEIVNAELRTYAKMGMPSLEPK